jgi:hypothetical protein
MAALSGCGTYTQPIYSRAAQSVEIKQNSPLVRSVLDNVASEFHLQLSGEKDDVVWWSKGTMEGHWTSDTYTLIYGPKIGRIRFESLSSDSESQFAKNVLQALEDGLKAKGIVIAFYDDDRVRKQDFGPFLEHTRYPSTLRGQNNK